MVFVRILEINQVMRKEDFPPELAETQTGGSQTVCESQFENIAKHSYISYCCCKFMFYYFLFLLLILASHINYIFVVVEDFMQKHIIINFIF